MRIDILSLFPEMFAGPFGHSIVKRAIDNDILDISVTNFRDFAYDKHKQVDDSPFGGGSGMRSRMLLRSRSATPAKIVRRNRPDASPVSNGSVIDLSFTPRFSRSWMALRMILVALPRRSSL